MKKKTALHHAYAKYKTKKTTKKTLLSSFRSSMPEIIFRTTKLEGESVTRRMINRLFK